MKRSAYSCPLPKLPLWLWSWLVVPDPTVVQGGSLFINTWFSYLFVLNLIAIAAVIDIRRRPSIFCCSVTGQGQFIFTNGARFYRLWLCELNDAYFFKLLWFMYLCERVAFTSSNSDECLQTLDWSHPFSLFVGGNLLPSAVHWCRWMSGPITDKYKSQVPPPPNPLAPDAFCHAGNGKSPESPPLSGNVQRACGRELVLHTGKPLDAGFVTSRWPYTSATVEP